jgi:hypothetical protein
VSRLAPALLALLLVTGCAERGEPVREQQSQDSELRERPSLEAEQARLTAVQEAVRDRLAEELGLTAWSQADQGNAAGCVDFPDSSGYTAFLPTLLLEGGVPDGSWPRAVQVVSTVVSRQGFGAPEVVVDEPGRHEVVLRGEYGSLLRFGTMKNATLHLETGCHLPERAGS